ncbi:MAG TPA: hypothetical protein VGH87_13360 [Polyangiaceae bacterium]
MRDDLCPFCGAAVAPVVEATLPRVARIALLGAAAAAVATACGTTTSPQPLYGAVIPDASADAGQDAIATFYGGVPFDSGPGDSGPGDSGNGDSGNGDAGDE